MLFELSQKNDRGGHGDPPPVGIGLNILQGKQHKYRIEGEGEEN